MEAPDLPFLQSERIIFKFYTCEEHLKNIKKIKSEHGDLLSKDARVSAEMEIDSLISQIIGTFDSLLFRIVDKFQLSGIPIDKIEISKVVSALSAESKGIELARELQKASQEGNWYWTIKDLQNKSLHTSLLSSDFSLSAVRFFEETLVKLKEFVKDMVAMEPKLQ
jgi:hypothetical protein